MKMLETFAENVFSIKTQLTSGWCKPDRANLWEVSTTERPSFTMSIMQFHRKRLAFGSIPVVGSSWTWHHSWKTTPTGKI